MIESGPLLAVQEFVKSNGRGLQTWSRLVIICYSHRWHLWIVFRIRSRIDCMVDIGSCYWLNQPTRLKHSDYNYDVTQHIPAVYGLKAIPIIISYKNRLFTSYQQQAPITTRNRSPGNNKHHQPSMHLTQQPVRWLVAAASATAKKLRSRQTRARQKANRGKALQPWKDVGGMNQWWTNSEVMLDFGGMNGW